MSIACAVILLVNCDPPPIGYAEVRIVDDLPSPESLRCTAVCIRVDDALSLAETADWLRGLRPNHPLLPIAMIASRVDPVLKGLLEADYGVRPIVDRPMFDRIAPPGLLVQLRCRSEVPRVRRWWSERYGAPGSDLAPILELIASAGSVGIRLGPRMRATGVSRTHAHRAFKRAGWPTPGRLWSEARALAVQLRIEDGVPRRDALLRSGWFSVKDYGRAVRRLGWDPK